MRYFSFLIFCLTITTVYPRLKVVGPSDFKTKYLPDDPNIKFQLIRSGKIPYGTNIVGTLVLASPDDACSALSDTFKTDKKVQVPILLVKGGNCSYRAKARQAQLVGAKMMIVIYDMDELPSHPIGVDTHSDIAIPTILIGQTDGNRFYDAIKPQTPDSDDKKKTYIVVSMSFPYGLLAKQVTLDFWLSASESDSNIYKLLRELKPLYMKSKESMKFRPHYVTWTCTACQDNFYNEPNTNCLSGGRYCAHDPDSDGPLNGSVVVMEGLRQICLNNLYSDSWWDYMDQFGSQCVNKEDQEDCVQRVLDKIGLTSDQKKDIESCIHDSFVKKPGSETIDELVDDNTKLREDRLQQEEYDISMFPALFINHQMYQGRLDASSVFRATCESLEEPTDICKNYGSITEYIAAKLDFWTIIIFMGVMLIFVLIILFFYRRMTRREMTKEMSIQVSQMVSQYFALNEGKKRQEY